MTTSRSDGQQSRRRPVLPASCGLCVVGRFLPLGCPREEKKLKLDLHVERLCSARVPPAPSPPSPQLRPLSQPLGAQSDSAVFSGIPGAPGPRWRSDRCGVGPHGDPVASGALCSPALSLSPRTCRVTLWLSWLARCQGELTASLAWRPCPSSPEGVFQGGTSSPGARRAAPVSRTPWPACPAHRTQLCDSRAGCVDGHVSLPPACPPQAPGQTVTTSCPAEAPWLALRRG